MWKSHGKVDEWRSQNRWRILTEVYAKLLAMLIEHWIMQVGCWGAAHRSLARAAGIIGTFALMVASAVTRIQRLREAIRLVASCLGPGARMHRRRKTPYT